MNVPVWTWEPGRVIARDGEAVLILARARLVGRYPLTPAEADALANKIVSLLNAARAT